MKVYLKLIFLLSLLSCSQQKFDVIIRDASILDGSGSPAITADVCISGDTIAAIGDFSKATATEIISGKGLILAPGFIDTHSHHDWGLNKNPDALAVVSQGVTTIVVGQDGGSNTPLKKYFDLLTDSPVAVNVASYAGHNTIRDLVMGQDFKKHATTEQVEKMKTILKDDMDAGALGLSTGLEYDPGIYSHGSEVLELSKILPVYGGRYISHLRSEDRYFDNAIDEIIQIGKITGIPVQISHFKLAMTSLWGKADATLQRLDSARAQGINITADIYPYPYWSSTIRVLFPERNFTDEREAAFILKNVTTPEGIVFSHYEPQPAYDGKSLAEVARLENKSPERMLIELIKRLDACDKKNGECSGSIVATSMSEADIDKLLQWKHSNICSDGASFGRHPRGFGAFTRILGKYVREKNIYTLPEAINRMTGMSAEHLGIHKRGIIKTGNYADLVLFDPANVDDRATISDPQAVSTGISRVLVNGKTVYADGKATAQHPGKVIRRGDN
jgi:N-acyl-D-amino-acid deacylase